MLTLVSFEIQCQAPLRHADPIPNCTLKSAALVLRHGMRTPMDHWITDPNSTWECDSENSISPRMSISTKDSYRRRYKQNLDSRYIPFGKSCDSGELILYGMQQHLELGSFYRKFLVDEMHFLPEFLDNDFINIRASMVERTIKSGQSFINGLYPAQIPGENVVITTGSARREVLYPTREQCHDIDTQWINFASSPEFNSRRQSSEALYDTIFKEFGLEKDETNWMFIGDYLISLYCANQTLPDYITSNPKIMEQGSKDIAYYTYGFFGYNQTRIAGSALWRRILRDFDRHLALMQHVGKLRIYSAHDITIGAILTSVGFTDDKLPPFRSHLFIELWEQEDKSLLIRLVLNGEPIKIDLLENRTIVPFNDFKKALEPFSQFCIDEFPDV